MGIIANARRFLAEKISRGAALAADGIARASSLSPAQVQEIAKKREQYLGQKPDMNSAGVQEQIRKNLGAVAIEVYQAYLEQLRFAYRPVNDSTEPFDSRSRIRYFDITKWVTDPSEKNLDKLVNVYQVLSEENCNIALLYHRTMQSCRVSLAVINTDTDQPDPARANTFMARVFEAMTGNFPGVEIRRNRGSKDSFGIGEPDFLSKAGDSGPKSVAIVSNLASEKSEDFISQSMEKLLDGIVPETEQDAYTIVLLAKPVTRQLELKSRLFELYSVLSPYASWQTSYIFTEADSTGASANFGVNLGLSAGSHFSVNENRTRLYAENEDDTGITGNAQKLGKGLWGKGMSLLGMYAPEQTGTSAGYNISANFGLNFSRSSSVTATLGKNEGISQNFTNFGVKHTLDVLETQLKRLDESAALGLWEFAAYVVAENPVAANNVAHMYLALTQGEQSFMTRAAVNLWDGEEDAEDAAVILDSVRHLRHPLFGLRSDLMDDSWLMYPALVTPSAVLSGKELAKSLNFPRKSVSGLPVLESVAFGREVQKFSPCAPSDRDIAIGRIYHMRHEEKTPVLLDMDSLTAHTFITGSTGTGKSNTVYLLLDSLAEKGVPFLVVEPAKGEYKKVFGGRAKVYGTNENRSEMLAVNPFSFPEKDIHVLEHIDRLIEIFNACWPMYAAMPAVLKDAVEKSYEKVGWNLRTSTCDPLRFPTFHDLIDTLPEVMNSSLYSADTKSDYSGALITRVRSLTNGINGQIFCSGRECTDKELFGGNVIVDLSRVGSSETRALMMGVLVMKLQEYRMAQDAMNERLVHVTVLEEAHNLLRRTSASQSPEGVSLQGKAVEMLAGAIAELRSFGEGFIIADQAPGLLDESVIRNTNTKIVLRLPDREDRELAGGAMALTDDQTTELARLPKGVAAVYQNDWVEAVLCAFPMYEKACALQYVAKKRSSDVLERYFSVACGLHEPGELSREDVDSMKIWIEGLREDKRTMAILRSVLDGKPLSRRKQEIIIYNLFNGRKVFLESQQPEHGIEQADALIAATMGFRDNALINHIREVIMEVFRRIGDQRELDAGHRSLETPRGGLQ